MPRLVTLLALCFAIPVAAQPLPRIGAEIDQAERDYFGFFNDLSHFEHAEVEETGDGGVRFHIERAPGEAVVEARTMTAAQRQTLEAYLARYENQAAIEELDFRDLTGIVSYRAWYAGGEHIVVERMDGERVEGELLLVEPDRLVLWPGNDPYDWSTAAERVRVLRFSEIATLRTSTTQLGPRAGGTLAAALVGGANLALGAGTYFHAEAQPVQGGPAIANTVLSTSVLLGFSGTSQGGERVYGRARVARRLAAGLRDNVAFGRQVAPELWALPLPDPDPSQPSIEDLRRRVATPVVEVSLGGTYLFGEGGTFSGFYVDGTQQLPLGVVHNPPAAWYGDLRLGVSRRFRIGANVLYAPRAAGEPWIGYIYGGAVSGYGEVILKPHDPLFLSLSGRWSLSVAAGASHSWFRMAMDLDFAPPVLGVDPTLAQETGREVQDSEVGAFGRVTLGYHVSNAVSLVAAASYRPHSAVTIDAEERFYEFGTSSGQIYEWEAFSGTFPSLDLFVGTRLHF